MTRLADCTVLAAISSRGISGGEKIPIATLLAAFDAHARSGCPQCAAIAAEDAALEADGQEAPEPPCTCRQTDVDTWDASGCPAHDRRTEIEDN